MRRPLLAIAALLLVAATATPRYAGRPLADALQELQKQGLRIVYSDDVVRPEMIVPSEPRATTPRVILDEILAQQHLRAVAGPRGTLIIEKEIPPPPSRPQVSATIPPPKLFENIVVTPSRFDLMGSDPAHRELFDRNEVQRLPHFGDDLYRAIGRLPGTASADATARFHIRGGGEDETLVVLDGAEIEDPFHMKDFFRVFSTIDAESVGGVDVLTGGFPAEYGGRLSGVLDISTLDPDRVRTEAGISLLNTRLSSQGTWSDGAGEWLVSARHGYLRDLLNIIGGNNQVAPSYDDLLGKVQRTFGQAAVSAHVLASDDHLRFDSNSSQQRASYTDEYAWINARAVVGPRLVVRSVATAARFVRSRSGTFDDHQSTSGSASDDRNARFVSLKNDVRFEAGARQVIEAGMLVKRESADYDYLANASFLQSPGKPGLISQTLVRHSVVSVAGTQRSAFVSDRVRLTDRLVIEGGLRAASENYTPDGSRLMPRANLAWTPIARTAVRLAWGRFDQPQNVTELDVQDGLTKIAPAERAEHRVGGIEHFFGKGLSAKLEVYDKKLSSLAPRFENIYDRMALFPELRYDRVRIDAPTGRARGAELLVRFDGQPVSAWLSWARASATDRIDGRDVPRLWDQRNTITASTNYRAGNVWNVNVTALYHTGWPTTPVIATIVNGRLTATPGALDSERLPSYRRVDLRVSRNVETIHGVGSAFVELFNVLNESNATRISSFTYDIAADGSVRATAVQQSMFGIIPSFGVSWRF